MPNGRSVLDAAREALRTERQTLCTERDAFREFERRVVSLTPARDQVEQEGSATQLLGVSSPDGGTARIRAAYEETVMDVPHYEEEYGETLLENVRVELGSEYAEVLRTDTGLTPQLKQGILAAATAAREQRTRVLAVLDEEARMLDSAASIVDDVQPLTDVPAECPFECLCARNDQLRKREQRAEALLEERQAHIQEFEPHLSDADELLLNEHLYGSLSTAYPILHVITQLLEDIRAARGTIAHRIANWHPSDTA